MSEGNGRVRVVVTGLGAVSPLGNDRHTTWQSARAGRSGIDHIRGFDASSLPVRIAGEVKDFDAAELMGRKEARRSSRSIQFAIVAAREAVADSRLDIGAEAADVGVLIASGVGGLEWLERATLLLFGDGVRRVSPFTVPAMTADTPSGWVAIDLGAQGPNFGITSACASGTHAVGEAAEWIRRGDAVAVVCGGSEGTVTMVGIGTFAAMQALSTRNDEPQRASRPFDRDRDGFVMGEGAAVLVLEELGHARARGARIYAEVVGYSATSDASHLTQPDEDGAAVRRCLERALQRAGALPEDVGYINAHGTSTQLNDAAETRAVKAVFGAAAATVPMSSTKSMTGHLLGAAGALEAFFAVMAMHDQYLPPTINLDNPDPSCDMDYVPHVGREASPRLVLSTSFGFGGRNACLALTAPPED
ncbi:MAG TPA: beta-ketoacyl-ACP synthase II [Candidatus Dormibacteraeota bacterium]|jgi:3-oxoacyl-[acyl-carrier-protein] synthase II|nr:beta-ketoacyl-ACP synthase II [Candidatus Dormibacteraeota bacterium]